ncbi:MAG: hypothetical protein IT376_13555 [Polyangiaceae bacterium]|nr:hypothetical protein [Polyangiaceae bacterium]
MTEYVERRLARAPALPELPGARLAGARRCNLGGTPAALIFYEWSPTSGRSERVSLFVFASPGVELAELGRPVDLPGSPAVVAEQRGVAMVFWSDRGLTHAMAAAAPAPELTALLAAAR